MTELLSYESLGRPLWNLRAVGSYQISNDSSKSSQFWHSVYMKFVLLMISMYAMQFIVQAYYVRLDIDKVVEIVLLLLTFMDTIYKQVILWLKADKIEELLTTMKGETFNQNDPEHKKLLRTTIREANKILTGFLGIAIFTCALWRVLANIQYLQGKPVEFNIYLPIAVDSPVKFYIVNIYVYIITTVQAFSNITMDVFISFLLAQSKTQIAILRYNLTNLVQNCKNNSLRSTADFHCVIKNQLQYILNHHNDILIFSEKIDNIFNGALFFQLLVSGWIICTTAYNLVGLSLLSGNFLSMIFYMGGIITELFLFCHYGNEMTAESEKIIDSVYEMDWLELPRKHKKDLIIFMERSKQPLRLVAGKMIPLSADTFVAVLKTSYSFYAFLKSS